MRTCFAFPSSLSDVGAPVNGVFAEPATTWRVAAGSRFVGSWRRAETASAGCTMALVVGAWLIAGGRCGSRLGGFAVTWLVVAASASCSKGSADLRPPGEPARATPGPEPGHCQHVSIAPPCTFEWLAPHPYSGDAGDVTYTVKFRDANGLAFEPYSVRAAQRDRAALEDFYRSHSPVECSGGWTSSPCPGMNSFSGFPTPPVGSVVLP